MTSFKNENFASFTFVVKVNLRHLRTFSQVLSTVIKILQCSIMHFQMYINSLKEEYKIVS